MSARTSHDVAMTHCAQTRVSKKLLPGKNGTKRYSQQYGDALVCVRYRTDDQNKRYTTVELVVDERTLPAHARGAGLSGEIVAIRIEYHEADLRARAKKLGAKWDASQRLWRMPYGVASQLGLKARVVQNRKRGD